jgi:hypothetical protein
MRSQRGQATVEYVAAVTLLVIVFAGVTVAVAAPDLPRTVVAKLRLALCIVGGDVCRASDAAARGLEPCLVSAEEHQTENGVSFLFFRGGGTDFWSVQRRSDGSIVLTEGYGQDLTASTGIGVDLGPVHAGGSAGGGGGFRSGRSWTVTEARLRDLLSRTHGDPTKARYYIEQALGEPDETFLEGAGSGSAQLAVEAIRTLPGAGAEARAVLGRRHSKAGTSYYVDLGTGSSGPITDAVPGTDLAGHVIAEYRASDPPVITLRTNGRVHDGTETRTVLRLALRDAADRDAARRVAFLALHDPALAVRDLVARIRARGTVERLRYRTHEDAGGWDYGIELGVKLGADHATSRLRRDLIDAQVLNGPFPAERYDCIMAA